MSDIVRPNVFQEQQFTYKQIVTVPELAAMHSDQRFEMLHRNNSNLFGQIMTAAHRALKNGVTEDFSEAPPALPSDTEEFSEPARPRMIHIISPPSPELIVEVLSQIDLLLKGSERKQETSPGQFLLSGVAEGKNEISADQLVQLIGHSKDEHHHNVFINLGVASKGNFGLGLMIARQLCARLSRDNVLEVEAILAEDTPSFLEGLIGRDIGGHSIFLYALRQTDPGLFVVLSERVEPKDIRHMGAKYAKENGDNQVALELANYPHAQVFEILTGDMDADGAAEYLSETQLHPYGPLSISTCLLTATFIYHEGGWVIGGKSDWEQKFWTEKFPEFLTAVVQKVGIDRAKKLEEQCVGEFEAFDQHKPGNNADQDWHNAYRAKKIADIRRLWANACTAAAPNNVTTQSALPPGNHGGSRKNEQTPGGN